MIAVVFFDVGGPLYDDSFYYEGLLTAIREVRPELDPAKYWEEFREARREQNGSFTQRLAKRFVDADEVDGVVARGRDLWDYPAEALLPDVRPMLTQLQGSYRLGILANQETWIRGILDRDDLGRFFDVWAVSEEIGSEKPDPAIFRSALEKAGVPAHTCVMVGDRLDNDVLPARSHGMKTIWLLRGEAPEDPTAEQLAEADAAIHDLSELPETLRRLGD